eukprot:TRINITY_DN67264_c9_g1_i1.p2 TRINITY_DN67264_c9_g1~~TRINITY_DN67264_c9_g1_i1.p2  ORF type:complete len:169 (-),score=70.25 TRINITY_DN67264_c9_g1_i1:167-673(-)
MCNSIPVYSGNNRSIQVNKCCPLLIKKQWNVAQTTQQFVLTETGMMLNLRPSGVQKVQGIKGVAVLKVRENVGCCSCICTTCCRLCPCSCDCKPIELDGTAPIADVFVVDKEHDACCPGFCGKIFFFCSLLEYCCCTRAGCCVPTLTTNDFFEYDMTAPQGPGQQQMK